MIGRECWWIASLPLVPRFRCPSRLTACFSIQRKRHLWWCWGHWTWATLLQRGEQWQQGLPTCQKDTLWSPGFFLPSLSNQTKWNGAICGFRSGEGSAHSNPRHQRVEIRANAYRTLVHFPVAARVTTDTAQATIHLPSRPWKGVRKLPSLLEGEADVKLGMVRT